MIGHFRNGNEAVAAKEVSDLLAGCGIDRKDLAGSVILINGKSANKRSKLTEDDTVLLMSHVMKEFDSSAHKRLAELADVCGIGGANETEKANAFIRWIEETNAKMDLPDKFDVVKDEDIDQMITWAKKEANPLYPVPVVWARKDFRRLIESIRK